MKQGLKFLMDVDIDYELNDIQSIYFIFVQGKTRKMFQYPSTTAIRKSQTNTVQLIWDVADTYLFSTKDYVQMDTKITLKENGWSPETSIANFRLAPTLFTQYEIENGQVQDND